MGGGNLDYSLGYLSTEVASIFVSPYQFSLASNPLEEILDELVDFEELKECEATKLFVCATNVRRGRAKVFSLDTISKDAVLASACLPTLFKAVTIDGEDYWDGGFMGNPPIFPLIDAKCDNIMIVQINPINIDKTPTTSAEIRDRVNELSFNSSLMLEMRKIDTIDRLMSKGLHLGGAYRKIYLHAINPEDEVQNLNVSSKFNTSWGFLQKLFDIGYRKADAWLSEHYDKIGKESTVNIREMYLE